MPTQRTRQGVTGVSTYWVVNYYSDGKRRQRSFNKKVDALRFEKSAERPRRKRRLSARPTFAELAGRYVTDSTIGGRDGAPPWERATRKKVAAHLKALGSVFDLESTADVITPSKVREVRQALLSGIWKRAYAASIFRDFKAVLAYAHSCELIPSDPSSGVTIRNIRVVADKSTSASKLSMHTKEEAALIHRTALALRTSTEVRTAKTWSKFWLLPFVLFELGIRIGELMALQWSEVDFNNQSVTIRFSVERDTGRLKETKTSAGFRTLYMSDDLTAALEQRKILFPERYVFPNNKGEPTTYRSMLSRWHILQEAAGVPMLGFHSARHHYASRLIEAQVDPKVLSSNMGHTDVAFTLQQYGHLFDDRYTRERKKDIANAMSMFQHVTS